MRILHLDQNHPVLIQKLKDAGHHNDEGYDLDKEACEKIIGAYDGIVIRSRFPIDRLFLDAATNLKFVARVGAGLESIDTAYAEERGVALISAPEGNQTAVAEHALGLLLNLTNKLNLADASVKNGQWHREQHRGVEIAGKTVGIIGYGHMGKAFAKRLQGFDCKVLCYDILQDVGDAYATQVPLEELQRTADILSLHTPWTPETNRMIHADFINAFAKSFYFINTARGKSVVTADLVDALQRKKILGAGLDVLEYEKGSFEQLFTDPKQMPAPLQQLLAMPNVVLSPHVAGWTIESREKLAQTIVSKILKTFV